MCDHVGQCFENTLNNLLSIIFTCTLVRHDVLNNTISPVCCATSANTQPVWRHLGMVCIYRSREVHSRPDEAWTIQGSEGYWLSVAEVKCNEEQEALYCVSFLWNGPKVMSSSHSRRDSHMESIRSRLKTRGSRFRWSWKLISLISRTLLSLTSDFCS